ncbi:isopentenyl pyrophosphate isomerase [Poriferisphaera corsica]|uniref:Isopentenyl pyrophosphate isomerase n=2 Tax=Poriferisphaera corsica TaxID=2528020 RepID=A0A517YVG2_9BACT|nr:isopentenyl pyrophosphate isomerase [Poriferisphaera corsica]
MYKMQDTLCTHCNFCSAKDGPNLCYAARTARFGLEGNFPTKDDKANTKFGKTQSAGEQFHPGTPRYKAFRDIIFMPELLGTDRVAKMAEVGYEPLYTDCKSASTLGGFEVASPLVCAAMGSTPVANDIGPDTSAGCALAGICISIGENIVNMWGYDKPYDEGRPTLVDRIEGFTKNYTGKGGVIIQQNVEDNKVDVWKTIYNDPRFAEAFDKGMIGFEGKGGQGAKPGMGGEVKIPREKAKRIHELYHFPVNPFEVEQELYQRHSVPGTATSESLEEYYTWMCTEFPKAKIWFKTGPYGDLFAQLDVMEKIATKFGLRINCTIDGGEGGTGMSPLGPMNDMGLPMVTCMLAVKKARKMYQNLDFTIAGGMVTGRDLAKSLAMGADGMGIGKGFLIATMAGRHQFAGADSPIEDIRAGGAKGVYNYAIEGITNEAKMLISSIAKYDFNDMKDNAPYEVSGQTIDNIDVVALDKDVAEMFDILYAYDAKIWDKLPEITAEMRKRCEEKAAVTA